MSPDPARYVKLSFAALMAVYGTVCAWDPSDPSMLDRVNLIAHEAGHLFFRWFGEFLSVMGGTVGQLFVPAAFAVHFLRRNERFSAAVALFWAGQNFFSIATYVRDAQALLLPLVSIGGGDDTIHDWHYLLSRFGLLRYDRTIGTIFHAAGVLIIVAAVVWAFRSAFERPEEVAEG